MSKIVIVGSGVVGTATGKGFAHHGHAVSFVDINEQRVEQLRAEGLAASTEVQLTDEPTFVFLTLPTPNDGYSWDLEPMRAGSHAVGRALRDSKGFHTVVVRSTVPPGSCDKVVTPILEETSGKPVNHGFAVGSNPEFLRAVSALQDFLNPWVTLVASRSPRTVEQLHELLAPMGGEIFRFRDPAEAEFIKCSHNIYNAAKISFWNEMWQVGGSLGLDVNRLSAVVAKSAEGSINPEYGIRGGSPYGGACLPKDTKGFLGFARDNGFEMPLLTAVDEVNERVRHLLDHDDLAEFQSVYGGPDTAPPSERRTRAEDRAATSG